MQNDKIDAITGLPFTLDNNDLTDLEKASELSAYFKGLSDEEKVALYTKILSTPPTGYIENQVSEAMKDLDTREKMIAMIAEYYPQYVGMFDRYSDEQLKETIEKAIAIVRIIAVIFFIFITPVKIKF